MVKLTLPAVAVADTHTPTPAGRLVVPGFTMPARDVWVDEVMVQRLLLAARDASERAYAPFSQFRVGAAALMDNDAKHTIFTGTNVENSSYGGTICAERTALTAAASAGFRRLRYIAVCVRDALDAPLCDRSPCGLCRQFMRQFCEPQAASPSLIFVADGQPDTLAQVMDIERLLPWGFRFAK